MWGGGIKRNGNYTNVIFPTRQELFPIYGTFIEHNFYYHFVLYNILFTTIWHILYNVTVMCA